MNLVLQGHQRIISNYRGSRKKRRNSFKIIMEQKKFRDNVYRLVVIEVLASYKDVAIKRIECTICRLKINQSKRRVSRPKNLINGLESGL